MLSPVLDRAESPDLGGTDAGEAIDAMRRSVHGCEKKQHSRQITAHYALEGQHPAITVLDTKGRQELGELLARWPRLKTDPEIYHLVSVSPQGPDEVEAILYRMAGADS